MLVVHLRRGREPEIDKRHAAAARQNQVGGLDVAVDDRRLLGVQEGQRLCGIGQVRQDTRDVEPGSAARPEQSRQVDSVDPVQDDHILVALEEVVSHER